MRGRVEVGVPAVMLAIFLLNWRRSIEGVHIQAIDQTKVIIVALPKSVQ